MYCIELWVGYFAHSMIPTIDRANPLYRMTLRLVDKILPSSYSQDPTWAVNRRYYDRYCMKVGIFKYGLLMRDDE